MQINFPWPPHTICIVAVSIPENLTRAEHIEKGSTAMMLEIAISSSDNHAAGRPHQIWALANEIACASDEATDLKVA